MSNDGIMIQQRISDPLDFPQQQRVQFKSQKASSLFKDFQAFKQRYSATPKSNTQDKFLQDQRTQSKQPKKKENQTIASAYLKLVNTINLKINTQQQDVLNQSNNNTQQPLQLDQSINLEKSKKTQDIYSRVYNIHNNNSKEQKDKITKSTNSLFSTLHSSSSHQQNNLKKNEQTNLTMLQQSTTKNSTKKFFSGKERQSSASSNDLNKTQTLQLNNNVFNSQKTDSDNRNFSSNAAQLLFDKNNKLFANQKNNKKNQKNNINKIFKDLASKLRSSSARKNDNNDTPSSSSQDHKSHFFISKLFQNENVPKNNNNITTTKSTSNYKHNKNTQPNITNSKGEPLKALETNKVQQNDTNKYKYNNNTKDNQKSLKNFVTHLNRGELFAGSTKSINSLQETLNQFNQKISLTPKIIQQQPQQQQQQQQLITSKTSKNNQQQKVFLFGSTKHRAESANRSKSQKNINRPSTADNRKRLNNNNTSEIDQNTQHVKPNNTNEKQYMYYMTNLENSYKNLDNKDYFYQLYREHFIQTYQSMSFCKILKPADPKVIADKILHLPKLQSNIKTIVFDLDETLIHCNESVNIPYDVLLPIKFRTGEVIEASINVRPYAKEILKELSKTFEIIVFTASHACYANVVLDYLDPDRSIISHRLFRDNCVTTQEGIYIKDLRVLANRDLSQTLIVDNAAYSFGYQIENGIPIIPFYSSKEDKELLHLANYLLKFKDKKDVREFNSKTFKFYAFTEYDTLDKIVEHLFS